MRVRLALAHEGQTALALAATQVAVRRSALNSREAMRGLANR